MEYCTKERMKEKRYSSHMLVILSSLIWGSSFPVMKLTLETVSPFLLTTYRLGIAAIVGLILLTLTRNVTLKIFKDKFIFFLAFMNAISFVFQHQGLTATSASKASLLININVVFVATFSAFVLKEEIGWNKAFALILGVFGVSLLATRGTLPPIRSEEFLSDILVFSAGAIWALYIVYTKKATSMQYDLLELAVAVLCWTAILLAPLALFQFRESSIDRAGWLGIVYLGVACTTIALFIWIVGLKGISATVSSILLLLEVVFAIVLSVIFLGDRLTLLDGAGGLLVFIAIILASFSNHKQGFLGSDESIH